MVNTKTNTVGQRKILYVQVFDDEYSIFDIEENTALSEAKNNVRNALGLPNRIKRGSTKGNAKKLLDTMSEEELEAFVEHRRNSFDTAEQEEDE